MTVSELIEVMSKLPPHTKILIDTDTFWGELSPENVEYVEAFSIWHSEYNGKGTEYTSFSTNPQDSVRVRGNGKSDYIRKTVGSEFVLSLG